MAGKLSTILGCLLAVGIVPVGADTVSSYLAKQRKFEFKFKDISFVGKITKIRNGATTATSCKNENAGMLIIDVIRKDEKGGLFKSAPVPETAYLTVCLNGGGILELRPVTASASELHATGVTISSVFWEKCGIAKGEPSDEERKAAGNAMLNSLNALVAQG